MQHCWSLLTSVLGCPFGLRPNFAITAKRTERHSVLQLPYFKLWRPPLHSEQLVVLTHYGKLRVFPSLHDVFNYKKYIQWLHYSSVLASQTMQSIYFQGRIGMPSLQLELCRCMHFKSKPFRSRHTQQFAVGAYQIKPPNQTDSCKVRSLLNYSSHTIAVYR